MTDFGHEDEPTGEPILERNEQLDAMVAVHEGLLEIERGEGLTLEAFERRLRGCFAELDPPTEAND